MGDGYALSVSILITGGAGFIGSNLVGYLNRVSPETRITVLDDLSSGSESNLSGLAVELVRGSILDGPLVDSLCDDATAVVHLAARPSVPKSLLDPVAAHQVNASGTFQVLEAARRVNARVIAASSSSVYGSNPVLPKVESMATRPMSPYAASKLASEAYVLAWGRSYGMETVAFRFFNVYGPGQAPGHAYAAVIPAFLAAAAKGEPLKINGDGTQTRDFTFVDTVCEVLAQSALRGIVDNGPVNLALGTRTSLNELAAMVQDVVQQPLSLEYGPPRVGDVPHSSADSTLLKSLFPSISQVPLEVGLAKTYEWILRTLE